MQVQTRGSAAMVPRAFGHAESGHGRGRIGQVERRTRGLGWFSIGLGLAQILAPSSVARFIGVRDDERTRRMLQAVGMRELGTGVGILTHPESAGWVWARVLGDVMDLSLLSSTLESRDTERDRVLAATFAVAGITALDALSATQLARIGHAGGGNGSSLRERRAAERRVRMVRAVTVKKPRAEVYAFWRNFENLPRFLDHVESIQVSAGLSRWRARAFGPNPLEWDAEIVVDRPGESIEWRSLEGGAIISRGKVQFLDAPGGRGTEVSVELEYQAGMLGVSLAKLFGELPAQQIENDLRRFKQVLEIGEVVHSDASIHRGMHPAQPSSRSASPAMRPATRLPARTAKEVRS